jgi:hypothetical protein
MILTDARAGLARSGATRSGYPVLEGFKVPLFALSNIARSGATRSNYVDTGHVFIDIGGVNAADHVLYANAQIVDTLDETPTTGTLSTFQFHPVEGQEVIIRLGSQNQSRRLFAGNIIAIDRSYAGKPANAIDTCRLIDYTWGLGKRQVRTRYLSTTVAAIVADLVATYAPGYGWRVEADIGAEVLDEITFTETSLPGCLSQLTRRVGGNWICDYQKVVQVFFENTLATNPAPLNAVHPTLLQFQATRDLSQIVTRALVEGGGVTAFATCAVGETILPLDGEPSWYSPSGGTVVAGPQRITYTGVSSSTGGGMVGPGASPTGRPTLTQATGSGIEAGTHSYAVTFTTASGESVAGPVATIDVGPVAAPLTAPAVGEPQGGLGPEVGTHGYAVTFLTASGETMAGPTVSVATGIADPPTTAPVVGVPTPSATGVDAGQHEYAVSFVNANGETTPGPIGGAAATAAMPAPDVSPSLAPAAGAGLGLGGYYYVYTFATAAGETTQSPWGYIGTGGVTPPPVSSVANDTGGGSAVAWVTGDALYFRTAYQGASGVVSVMSPQSATIIATSLSGSTAHAAQVTLTRSADPLVTNIRVYLNRNGTWVGYSTGPNSTMTGFVTSAPNAGSPPTVLQQVAVSGIATGPPGTTARRIFRSPVNGSGLKLCAILADNVTTGFLDAKPDAMLDTPVPPATNTAATNSSMPVQGIEKGPTGTSGRKLYRRSGGAPGLKLVTTIANNSATTYTDTTPNASLGAAPPTVNTATTRVIPLTAIAIGAGALVTARKVYRTAANAAQLKLLTTLADNTTTAFLDTVVDASLGANVPTSTTATANRVTLTAIPVGAAAVTSRKLYRTAANAAQLKLLTTLADNVTTTYTDSSSLAVLGANVPVADTSGLTQPQGSVYPGATSFQVANIGPFPPSGWAVIGNGQQVIRYTSVTGSVLGGIPSTGAGSIVAAISFNSTVTAAPVLTGIPASGTGSIRVPILRGDDVNVFIVVNDVAAQAALAALIGGDGVQEHYLQDRRLSIRECTARAQAQLELRRDVHVEIQFQTHDINTRAGSTVSVNLGAPFFLIGEFVVQQVTIDFIPTRPPMPPRFTASASSYRLTFEDLLRAIKAKD